MQQANPLHATLVATKRQLQRRITLLQALSCRLHRHLQAQFSVLARKVHPIHLPAPLHQGKQVTVTMATMLGTAAVIQTILKRLSRLFRVALSPIICSHRLPVSSLNGALAVRDRTQIFCRVHSPSQRQRFQADRAFHGKMSRIRSESLPKGEFLAKGLTKNRRLNASKGMHLVLKLYPSSPHPPLPHDTDVLVDVPLSLPPSALSTYLQITIFISG